MRPFEYLRPTTIPEAVEMLRAHGSDARVLAGGTDLIIRLRDRSLQPSVVVDVKRVPALSPSIAERDGSLVISATTVMTDIMADDRVRRYFPALAEAAAWVGSVQIRNRATLAGNVCNASPAADTAPALLVHGAVVIVEGPTGRRGIPADDVFVRSGVTMIAPDELVTAIELPVPSSPGASAHVRRTRRRGHDLASVTLACAVDGEGVTRIAYGSVGPRPVLAVEEHGVLADPSTSDDERAALVDALVSAAAPSTTSMRASPRYRLAMLRVLGMTALHRALERRAAA